MKPLTRARTDEPAASYENFATTPNFAIHLGYCGCCENVDATTNRVNQRIEMEKKCGRVFFRKGLHYFDKSFLFKYCLKVNFICPINSQKRFIKELIATSVTANQFRKTFKCCNRLKNCCSFILHSRVCDKKKSLLVLLKN